MDRDKILVLLLVAVVLAVFPKTECQLRRRPIRLPLPPAGQQRPLCLSQFSLANYACSQLPVYLVRPPAPVSSLTSPPSLHEDDDDDHRVETGHGQGHRHGHGRRHHHGHRHRHHHGHRHRHEETPEEKNCCRWLKQVDNECVCDLLVHLPLLLSKPIHSYSVTVDASCVVTYNCSGRYIP